MITIGFSTREYNQKYIDYLTKTCGLKNVEVIQKVNNGEKSLSKVYNEILDESTNDIIIFCHDDLEFDTLNWGKRILKHFEKSDFGILGVAGTTEMPQNGMWWHDKRKMIGIVNHKHNGKKWESKYSKSWGDDINECCLVDGLFIAVDRTKLKERFDENVKGFHFYDVYFSIKNFINDVKIGVIYNVRITHLSIGQTNESWEENRKVFEEEYRDKLPLKSNINIDYNIRDFKFLKKYKLKIILSAGEDIDFVKETIEKIKSFDIPNYDINLISNENNYNDIKVFEGETIKVYEGVFSEQSKNLSILKWEDNFVNETYDLIFFVDKNVKLLNNVFSSITEIYHKEKHLFGCAFTTSVNDDLNIFTSKFNLVKDKENKLNIVLDSNGSFYNILNGYSENKLGNLSDVFATTYYNLIKNDWFDIQYDTNVSFNDFAIKCSNRLLKCFCDTNSVTTHKSFENSESFKSDLNKLLQNIMSNDKTQKIIKEVNG